MKSDNTNAFLALFYIAIVSVMAWGWIANIVKLVGIVDHGVTTMFIVRVVGIFVAPVGVILGFC